MQHQIEIKRNIIERFLMAVKESFVKNRKVYLYSFIALIATSALIVAGIIYHEKRAESELIQFEKILEKYYAETDKEQTLAAAVADLNKVVDSSYWGYVHNNGYYVIAGLYLSLNKNKEGKDYLLKFADQSPRSYFAPLALERAGIACEQTGNYDEALKIYLRLEKDYETSFVADQTYYNLGRMYHRSGEAFKAKEYYNKVIVQFPMSVFTAKAKKQILLLGYKQD